MYVETMTLGDITKEIMKDKTYLLLKIVYVTGDTKYRKFCMKLSEKKLHFFKRVDFTSKQTRLDYHLIPFTFGKRDYLKNSLGFLIFVTFRKGNQLWACFLCDYISTTIFFTPHFFDRYEEREEKDAEGRLSLMTDFFSRNRVFNHSDYTHPNHQNSLFWTMEEGVGFGTELEDHSLIVTTYVRNDMLFDGQANIKSEKIDRVIEAYQTFAKGADYSFNAA